MGRECGEQLRQKMIKQAEDLNESVFKVFEKKIKHLQAELNIKTEFIRTRQCPDHSGKWDRGRCLQCEVESLQAEVERLTECMVEGPPLRFAYYQASERADRLQAALDEIAKLPEKWRLWGDGYLDVNLYDCADEIDQIIKAAESGGKEEKT